MKLNESQIRSAVWGAVRVCAEEGGIGFHRFTEEEEALYREIHTEHQMKTLATSGVRLVFRTDSSTLRLAADFLPGTSRSYYSLDVLKDGAYLGCIRNHEPEEMIPDYTAMPLPLGPAEGSFELGAGEKTVTVVLPWSVRTVLKELVLEDGASFVPLRPKKKLLVYGDSITQGYDALHPSCRYASLLADSLGAEEINKAIGGEVFFPELAGCENGVEAPDYISVAYGTNDWKIIPEREFEENCKAFYRILSDKYPMAKIIAITPIWRKDIPDLPDRRPFHLVGDYIRKATADLPNVTVIEGWGFVPADESYFADLRLHPNDKGFAEYHKSLWKEVRNMI